MNTRTGSGMLTALALAGLSAAAHAQIVPALEIDASTMPGGTGPALTTSVTLANNANNPTDDVFAPAASPVTVTLSLEDLRFPGSLPADTWSPPRPYWANAASMAFGMNSPASAGDLASQSTDIYRLALSSVGPHEALSDYSPFFQSLSGQAAPGGITENNGAARLALFPIFASGSGRIGDLDSAGQVVSTGDAVPYGNLVIRFDQPVTNPVLHIEGLGGLAARRTTVPRPLPTGPRQEFFMNTATTDFELTGVVTADGGNSATLERLVGNPELQVSGNTIANGAAAPWNAFCVAEKPPFTAAQDAVMGHLPWASAACGSVVIKGKGVTQVTFAVSLRGFRWNQYGLLAPDQAANQNGYSDTDWLPPNDHGSYNWFDGMNLSVSVPPLFQVGGNVVNDANGNTDGLVNGTGTNVGSANLTAYLVDHAGQIVAAAPVAADGSYRFDDVPAAAGYTVVLANTPGLSGAAPVTSLPDGWSHTGDQVGTTPGDASAATPGVSTAFDVGGNVTDVNFGLTSPPDVITTVSLSSTGSEPGSTVTATVGWGNIGGNEAQNASVTLQLPPGLNNVVPSNGGVYDPATGIVTWPPEASVPALTPGAGTYTVTFALPPSRTVQATSNASVPGGEITTANNTSTATLTYTAPVPTLAGLTTALLAALLFAVPWARRRRAG